LCTNKLQIGTKRWQKWDITFCLRHSSVECASMRALFTGGLAAASVWKLQIWQWHSRLVVTCFPVVHSIGDSHSLVCLWWNAVLTMSAPKGSQIFLTKGAQGKGMCSSERGGWNCINNATSDASCNEFLVENFTTECITLSCWLLISLLSLF
jgi:hypothetical protein